MPKLVLEFWIGGCLSCYWILKIPKINAQPHPAPNRCPTFTNGILPTCYHISTGNNTEQKFQTCQGHEHLQECRPGAKCQRNVLERPSQSGRLVGTRSLQYWRLSFHFTSNWQDGLEEITGACIKTKGTWVYIHFRVLRKCANILLSSIIKWRSVQLEALSMQLTRTFDTILNSKWHNYDGPKTYVPYMTLWAAKHSPQGGNPKQTSFQQVVIQLLPCILFKIFGTKSALTTYPIRCHIRGVDVLN